MNSTLEITFKNRLVLVQYLETLTVAQLNAIPPKFNNNIIWNIIHIIAVQQALVYGLSGVQFKIDAAMVKAYAKGTKPEKEVSAEEISEIKNLLTSTIESTQTDLDNGIFKEYQEYTTGLGNTLTSFEEAIDFNNFHEGIHLGAIFALKKFV